VLVVEGLVKRFGGFTAVNQVSFRVEPGEILGLIGPNGSGKSTIFNMLSGTFAPSAGSVKFDGVEISGLAPHRIINRGIGRTSRSAAVPPADDLRERGAGGYFGRAATAASRPRRLPNAPSAWSACRPTAPLWSTVSAPPA